MKLQYTKTIQSIYPADEKALERLPYLIAADMEKDYYSNCRVQGNKVSFITTIPFGQDPYQTSLNAAIDSGLITVSKSDQGHIQVQYKLDFTYRVAMWSTVVLLIVLNISDSAKWPTVALFLLFYLVAFFLAKSAVISTIEDALKHRYR